MKNLSTKNGTQWTSISACRSNSYILKKDPRHPVTALVWWYEVIWYGIGWHGMVWQHGIGMVTWYWYEWDMVWVFHTMVPWYWYGAHIPRPEWVPWRYPRFNYTNKYNLCVASSMCFTFLCTTDLLIKYSDLAKVLHHTK